MKARINLPQAATGLFCILLLSTGGIAFAQAEASAAADDDPLLLRTSVDLTYQYTYRSQDVLVEAAAINKSAPYASNGIDLMRNVVDVPPFASIDWELGRKEGLAIGFDAELRKAFSGDSYDSLFSPDNFLTLGQSENPIAIEKNCIRKGALYWRSENLDLTFGRDKVDFDDGLKGSLYPSPRLPYIDAFQAKGKLGRLGMDWIVATSRATGSWDGVDVDPNSELNPTQYPLGAATPANQEPYGFMSDPNPTIIIEALHRFTWDFGKFQLGAAGHVVYARRNNYFLITDFLPVMSWHQSDVMSNNMTLLVDASWEPFEGLRIMADAGLDEVNARTFGVNDSGSPTVPACVLGANYTRPLGQGTLDAYLEAGYTHWLWGNYNGYNDAPGDGDPLAREQYRLPMNAGDGLIPMTSPYGPGATWGLFSGSWKPEDSDLRFGFDLLVLSKVIAANLIYTDPLGSPPDMTRFLFVDAAIPVSWSIGSFELYAKPALLTRDGTWWTEITLGAAYHFRRATPITALK